MNKGVLFIIAGPSGSGKGTIIKGVLKKHPEYRTSLSLTTRKKRHGEVEGKAYHFVSEDEFFGARDSGKLLEWALVHERYYYGVLKESILEYQ